MSARISADPEEALHLIENLSNCDIQATLYLKCGKVLLDRWKLPLALTALDKCIALASGNAELHRLRSIIQEGIGQPEAARASADLAFTLDPLSIGAFRQARKFSASPTEFVQNAHSLAFVELDRRQWSVEAVAAAAELLIELGNPSDAISVIDCFCHGATSIPVKLSFLRGLAHMHLRQFESALSALSRCETDPKERVKARICRGQCLFELGRIEEAEAALRENINNHVYHPYYFSLKQSLGEHREAWGDYRHRPVTRALKQAFGSCYVQSTGGLQRGQTTLVIAEGGIGDEIRFASTYSDLEHVASHLTITCDPRIYKLLKRGHPKIEFSPVRRWRSEFLWDNPASRSALPSSSLASILDSKIYMEALDAERVTTVLDLLADLRGDVASFSRSGPYFVADPSLVDQWRSQVRSSRPNVALSWRSLLPSAARNVHYLAASHLAVLKDIDANYWVVQPGAEPDEILEAALPSLQVAEGLDLVGDFENQAAFMVTMDCVVAPHTTTGELAGALDVPCVQFGCTRGVLWRHRPSGADIWHPKTRAVHGNPLGDKDATANSIASALRGILGHGSH